MLYIYQCAAVIHVEKSTASDSCDICFKSRIKMFTTISKYSIEIQCNLCILKYLGEELPKCK